MQRFVADRQSSCLRFNSLLCGRPLWGAYGVKMYNLLKKYNCNTIYHFTERKNLQSIINTGGLYSLAKINEMNLKDISYVSNDWSHDADSFKVSVNSSLNYSTHSPRILKGVISMFQGSSLFQSSAV